MQITPGEVMPIYSDREFDYVLKKHADQLVVVCASSTDCKPCQTFEPVFDVSISSSCINLSGLWDLLSFTLRGLTMQSCTTEQPGSAWPMQYSSFKLKTSSVGSELPSILICGKNKSSECRSSRDVRPVSEQSYIAVKISGCHCR